MDRTLIFVPGLALLLVASLLIAGCSTSDTAAQTTQTPPGAGPLYKAGDIVRNPASTANTAWLVLGYDAASDKYERALVYPNAGGSWGYRSDNRTEKTDRAMMEKVNTEVLKNVLPSAVPIVTPTIIMPEETARATVSVTAARTTTVPTALSITKIFPEEGLAGTSVSVKNLIGDNFVAGTTVALSRNGSTSITATDVRIVTNKSIICTFEIPSDAAVGAWDVTVRNPDGRSDTLTNMFIVHRDMSVGTTTSAVSAGTVPITYIDPPVGHIGYIQYVITGSKFQSGATMKLQKTGSPDIVAVQVIRESDTQIRCFINIPSGSMGLWDILITNPDRSYGRSIGVFTIN